MLDESNGNGHGQGVVAPKAEVVDIAEFRKRRGRDNLLTPVRLSDDLVVECAISNMETLLLEKRIPEPLVSVAIEVAGGATGGASTEKMDVRKLLRTVELQDVICGALIRRPRWVMTKDVRRNEDGDSIPPEDGLCLADLSDEERAAVAQLVYGGLPGLERFRERLRRRDAAVPDGEGVLQAAERDRGGDAGGLLPVRTDDVRPRDSDPWFGDEATPGAKYVPTKLDRVPGFG